MVACRVVLRVEYRVAGRRFAPRCPSLGRCVGHRVLGRDENCDLGAARDRSAPQEIAACRRLRGIANAGTRPGDWHIGGLGLLAFSYAMDAVLGGASFNIPVLDAALFNGVIVAPMVEEFTLRGFYLESLERNGRKFSDANVLQGIVFVALHLPGWYFQGRLRSPVSVLQPAVFLWLLALLLGWLKKQSGSLYAPMAVHVLNNIYAATRG